MSLLTYVITVRDYLALTAALIPILGVIIIAGLAYPILKTRGRLHVKQEPSTLSSKHCATALPIGLTRMTEVCDSVTVISSKGDWHTALLYAYRAAITDLLKVLNMMVPEAATEREVLTAALAMLPKGSAGSEALRRLYSLYERERFGTNVADATAVRESLRMVQSVYRHIAVLESIERGV